MSTAIYAGSFDIVTVGHLDIIKKACKLFDYLHIVIADNPSKKYLFDRDERYSLLWLTRNELSKEEKDSCVIVGYYKELICDYRWFKPYCDSPVLVRGIRNTTDMLEEMKLADINKEIGGVDTIFIPCSNEYRNVSSSLIKELIKYNKDISKYVPKHVEEAIRRKINE